MSPFQIFIGHDSRFPEPGRVLAYSLRKHSSIPLAIHFLDLRHLRDCFGWRRKVEDAKATTEFTYSRFLVPWLCGYAGVAAFMDDDMICLGDIAEVACLPMAELAMRVCQLDYRPPDGVKMYGAPQSAYPRKLWSSFMLLNCDRLQCWSPEYVATATGAQLHRFIDVPDDQIGHIDADWNEIHTITSWTKQFHWTEGMVWNRPGWHEERAQGRLDDFPYRDIWLQAYDESLKPQ